MLPGVPTLKTMHQKQLRSQGNLAVGLYAGRCKLSLAALESAVLQSGRLVAKAEQDITKQNQQVEFPNRGSRSGPGWTGILTPCECTLPLVHRVQQAMMLKPCR